MAANACLNCGCARNECECEAHPLDANMNTSTEEWVKKYIQENHYCWQSKHRRNPNCPQCNGRGDYPLEAGLHTLRNCEPCTTDESIKDAMREILISENKLPKSGILNLYGCWGWKDLWMKLAEKDLFYGKDKIFLRACIILCRLKEPYHCRWEGTDVIEATEFPKGSGWHASQEAKTINATEVWEAYFNVDCFAIEEAIKIFGTNEDIQELDLEASSYDADTAAQIYRVLEWMHNTD